MSHARHAVTKTRPLAFCAALIGASFGVACAGDDGPANGSAGATGANDGGAKDAASIAPDSGGKPVAVDAGGDDDASTPDDGGNPAHGDDAGTTSDGGLDPSLPPGGNFDLSVWELQEPVGSPGAPTTIAPSQLVGPNGYHDKYFFTDQADGSMTFWDPENGVTTPNSNYPRSELREMTKSGAAANWLTTGNHTLSAKLKATVIPNHTAVGQIHLGTGTPASTKPLLELFYYSSGKIELAIEQTPAGGNEVPHTVGQVALGTPWSYVIGLSGNTISVIIDGGAAQTFPMSSTFNQEGMYFKAGNYDQSNGSDPNVSATVQFYALTITHTP